MLARRLFDRWALSRPEGTSVRGAIAGLPADLLLSSGVDRSILLTGLSDPRGVRAIDRVMSALDCRTAWDVGANRGTHAASMLRRCRRLFAFEPNPAEFSRLSALLAGDIRATPIPLGLSDTEGELPFHIDAKDSGGSTLEASNGPMNATAGVTRGDGFAAERDIGDLDFVKIDVEGHELKTLRGMAGVIADQRPVVIVEILAYYSEDRGGEDLSTVLPGYRIFGNRTGLVSRVFRTAYDFGRFRPGVTYTHALCVPREKLGLLKGIVPA
jgi:FkbM family methyltransferase